MRHRVHDKKFNRDANARKAFLSGLLRNFIVHGEITTTMARAKVLKRLADRAIGQSKENDFASRRLLHKTFGKRDVVNTLVERVAPAMKDRQSGFVRVVALGNRRGDNTPMARISMVNMPSTVGTLQSGKTFAPKKTKPAVVKEKAKPAAKVSKPKTAKVKKAK